MNNVRTVRLLDRSPGQRGDDSRTVAGYVIEVGVPMSDLFHENVPDLFISQVFDRMGAAPQHVFQILTKRPQHMLEWFRAEAQSGARWPLPNVWIGVSAEDQAAANERIPLLLQAPAAVRWISAEPLLGPIDLTAINARDRDECFTNAECRGRQNALTGWCYGEDLVDGKWEDWLAPNPEARGNTPRLHPAIDWVVAGGESGPGARPMHPDWARSLRDQCAGASVPFFFKQWGAWTPYCAPEGAEKIDVDGCTMRRVGKKGAGRMLDGCRHDEYPSPRQSDRA